MYTDFYKLVAEPFQLTPDHRFFFGSSVHSQALAHLTYGLRQGEGFIVITGDIGAGKTTLVSQLLATLDAKKYIAAKVVTTQLDADDLLRTVVSAFGVKADFSSKADMLRQMEHFFTVTFRSGKRCLLLIDEAQNLTPQALEELRMLSNFQVGEKTPLQSFILGQPQFRALLNSPELEQLRQRIIANYHLGPLDLEETRRYIEHRLLTAGWENDPEIAPEAFAAVHRHTEGVPRRINGLCNRLFLYGFLEEKHALDEADVDRVARDLNREENPDIRGKDLVGLPRHQRSPVLHHDQGVLNELTRRLDAVESREPAAAPVDTRATEDLRRRLDMMEEYIRLRSVADRTYDDMMRRLGLLEEARASAPPPPAPIEDPAPRLQALEERLNTLPVPPDTNGLAERLSALENRAPAEAPAFDTSRIEALERRLDTLPAPPDTTWLVERLTALESWPSGPGDSSRIETLEQRLMALPMAPDVGPLVEHLAALESRLNSLSAGLGDRVGSVEGRLSTLPAPPDTGWLAERLSALENRPHPAGEAPDMARLAALEQRLASMVAPTDISGLENRLAAIESRPVPAGEAAPAVDTARLEALELRLAAQPVDMVDRIGRLEKALKADERSIGRRLDALEARAAAQLQAAEQQPAATALILDRLEALEKRDGGAPLSYVATLEARLAQLENAPAPAGIDEAAVEALSRRLAQIESTQRQAPPAHLIEDVKGRLTALEQAVAALPPAGAILAGGDDAQGQMGRDMEQRLDSLERKLTAQEAMLRRAIGLAAALLERGRPQEAQDAR